MAKQSSVVFTAYDQLPLILTVDNLAEVLGIARVNAYSLVHQNGFPKIVINRRILIPKQSFLEWISNKSKEGLT